ncbi:TonB-dependent receptor [Lysobacter tyrosinilyticus]
MLTPIRSPLALAPLYLALLAALPMAARAADVATATSSADADTSTATTGDAAAATLDAINVVGSRETRSVQTVGQVELQKLAPGTNPVKALEKLPGVHFVASDPWGSYEWSNRIAIRGFNQNQLGYTLDGIPLGDNSYANHNGLAPNRAILSENVAEVELAQGAGALGIPSTSNLGGALVMYSSDPLTEFGGRVGLAAGDNGLRRGFVRVDTGDFGGFSAYVSAMGNQADKWKGDGVQEQRQWNGKGVYQWDTGRIALWLSTSRRNETDYQDLSLDLLKRCGYEWDNYAPDWNRALNAAKGVFTGCVTNKDDAYYAARGLRDDWLGSLSGEFSLGDTATVKSTAYYHRNEGQGHWFTPYVISSPQIPMALRITSYDIERKGVNASVTWNVSAHHEVETGFWYEDSVHGAGRNAVAIDGPVDDGHFFPREDFDFFFFRQRFDTSTRQWYLQDTMSFLDDKLTVNAGFKGQNVVTDALAIPAPAGQSTQYQSQRTSGQLTTKDSFMPQVGVRWALDEHSDVFANYAENQVAFRAGVNGAWSLKQAQFDAGRANAKPESSRSLEVGYRTGNDDYQVSATLYGVRFDDRQLIIVPCAGVVSCPNQFANVGSVTTHGAELAFIFSPGENFRWFNSASFNDSQYDDDYINRAYVSPDPACAGATKPESCFVVHAGGKQVVDTPKQLFASEVEYHWGDFTAKLGGKYTGKRYYTYNNDAGVDAFWLWNGSVAWEKQDLGWLHRMRVSLDATNLLDKQYIATLGSNGFRDSDPNGTFATLLAGGPRQLFLSVDMEF